MVSSGNSSRSSSSICPMFNSSALMRPPLRRAPGYAGEEDEAVLADLHLIAAAEDHIGVDAVAVDVRAVETAEVGDHVAVCRAGERRVTTGHADVVEEYVAV